jgi:serine/threonine-protein kinase RsbT
LDANIRIVKSQTIPIQTEQDIVNVRKLVRLLATELQFSLTNQTKLMTAASELARNIFRYGGGGTAQLNTVDNTKRLGLQIIFEDQGPGIPDIELAMTDSYSTGGSLGMGLGGSKRLVDQFAIQSQPGQGTRISILSWK